MVWSLPFGRHSLVIDSLPIYGLALAQSGIPLVRTVGIAPPIPTGTSGSDAPAVQIHAAVPGTPTFWPRPPGDPTFPDCGQGFVAFLEGLSEPATMTLVVTSGNETLGTRTVTCLPPRGWPHDSEARVALGALVTPEDFHLSEFAAGSATTPTSGDPPATAVRDWYERLRNRSPVYEAPEVRRHRSDAGTWQEIRSPRALLGDAGPPTVNCLDLTLLLAGLLESIGHAPVIVLTGGLDGAPEHAVIGAWTVPGARFRPVIEDIASIRRAVDRDELWLIEATGVCAGTRGLEFAAAEEAVRSRLAAWSACHAIDVRALRPPTGRITPLVAGSSPTVHRALRLARQMGDSRALERRETLQLLFGLCRADGDVIRDVLGAEGDAGIEAVARVIERMVTSGSGVGPPRMTRNYQACLASARWHADQRCAGASIEEVDLVRAVLEAPSTNVRRVLEAAGYDPDTLPERIRRAAAMSRELTVSRVVAPPLFEDRPLGRRSDD